MVNLKGLNKDRKPTVPGYRPEEAVMAHEILSAQTSVATHTGWRSSILLRIDAEFLHSRKESGAVHSQTCGSTIGTADAPPACSECSYDLIALPSFILVSNAGLVPLRICSFFHDPLEFTVGAW